MKNRISPRRKVAQNSTFAPVKSALISSDFNIQPQAEKISQADSETVASFGHNLGHISLSAPGTQSSGIPIQPKLTIGQSGDKYEQEADRVAAQVVNNINSPSLKPMVQRLSDDDQSHQLNQGNKLVSQSTNGAHIIQAAKTKAADIAGVTRNSLFGSENDRRNMAGGAYINPAIINTAPVTIASTNGNQLTGNFYTPVAGGAATTVLILSGSGGSSEKYTKGIAREYVPNNAQVLAVNYRGFGGSYQTANGPGGGGGDPSEAGLYEDAVAMYDYLRNTVGVAANTIIVHGYSLGSPVAATLVKRVMRDRGENVKALILDRAMPSTYIAAKEKTSSKVAGRIGQALSGSMDTKEKLKDILTYQGGQNLPLLFTSGGGANDPRDANGDVKDDLADEDRILAGWAANQFNNSTSLEDRNAGHFDHNAFMTLLIPELQQQGLL
ncbi:MAG: lysophospholipase [Scytonematopsis contorta HA4267-MV1]|jgi:pimeloyl-ACP methyl ester carboxylesterase|nr:lysophospholipase [Scytonematopsis contorta HA4267-MV1]